MIQPVPASTSAAPSSTTACETAITTAVDAIAPPQENSSCLGDSASRIAGANVAPRTAPIPTQPSSRP